MPRKESPPTLFQPDHYRSAFESFEESQGLNSPSWMGPIRSEAFQKFTELGFPTPREEDWKYTNVIPYVRDPLQFSWDPFLDGLSQEKVAAALIGKTPRPLLVFVNGFFSREFSRISGVPQGVKVGSLREALRDHRELVEPHLTKIAPYEKNGFTALNTAFLQDGAFVSLTQGHPLEEPIWLLFISLAPQENLLCQPRNLVVLDQGSQAKVIESYVSFSKHSYFTNAVTEIVLKEGAKLEHIKIQREEKEKGLHVATTQVRLGAKARFSSFAISVGGKFSRENLNVLLTEEGSECVLKGLYLVSHGRHGDHHTLMDHQKPYGTSRQLYKGILNGKSTAVFNGKVFVHEGARKTDTEQTNKNLLLSREATVDTKPQLEIFNDDVKATHGAAVGELEEDQVFYLKSRGLDEENARNLLTYGFASEVVNQIENEPLRAGLDRLVWEWLHEERITGGEGS